MEIFKNNIWIAVVPLLLLPLIAQSIPESANFLLTKGKETEVRKILKRINPHLNLRKTVSFEKVVEKEKGSPLVKLFEKGRSRSTIMFWISCFCCFVLIYAMNTWLPKLMIQAALQPEQ